MWINWISYMQKTAFVQIYQIDMEWNMNNEKINWMINNIKLYDINVYNLNSGYNNLYDFSSIGRTALKQMFLGQLQFITA